MADEVYVKLVFGSPHVRETASTYREAYEKAKAKWAAACQAWMVAGGLPESIEAGPVDGDLVFEGRAGANKYEELTRTFETAIKTLDGEVR